MSEKKFGAFSSSTDPDKLSTTVQAIILGMSSLIIWGLGELGVPVTQEEIVQLAASVGIAISAIWSIFGILRKGAVKLGRAIQK